MKKKKLVPVKRLEEWQRALLREYLEKMQSPTMHPNNRARMHSQYPLLVGYFQGDVALDQVPFDYRNAVLLKQHSTTVDYVPTARSEGRG